VATVESAAPLPDDVRGSVTAGLVKTYGAGVTATFSVNPALVGGMRIKVGSDVYDGSVRARLAALEARL
jgi:F-type H+-transporting ATPase subunit delta